MFKHNRIFLADCLVALVTRIRSSANIRWLKLLLRVSLKPGTIRVVMVFLRIADRFWVTKRNSRGEMGSPCHTPRLLLNQGEGLPLISQEKDAEERQAFI